MFNTEFAQLSNKSGYSKTVEKDVTNNYYNWYQTNSSNWHNSMIAEVIQNKGIKIRYLRREMGSPDELFGEDPDNDFTGGFEVAMFLETFERYEGQGKMYQMVGYTMKDEAEFTINIDLFKYQADGEEPLEGDLVYIPMTNALFEIKYIDPEETFYQFGELPMRRLQCQKFTYSHEDIEDSYTDEDGVVQLLDELTNIADLGDEDEEGRQVDMEADTFIEFNPDDPFNTGYNNPL